MSSALIAIAQILGAIVAYIVLGFGLGLLGVMWQQRATRRLYEELSGRFGVSSEQIREEDEAYSPRMNQFFAERASSELFCNRLSDLCGVILTAWYWLGNAVTIVWLIGVAWFTITENRDIAIHAWWILAATLAFAIAGTVFSGICKLLTGRTPGEAKRIRKHLATVMKKRKSQEAESADEFFIE
jgi:hypothetical protein